MVWLASLGVMTDADRLFITHGGQHALSIALGMVGAARRHRADRKLHLFRGN
jgi:DNA-binding transcriptional MocR family regulator